MQSQGHDHQQHAAVRNNTTDVGVQGQNDQIKKPSFYTMTHGCAAVIIFFTLIFLWGWYATVTLANPDIIKEQGPIGATINGGFYAAMELALESPPGQLTGYFFLAVGNAESLNICKNMKAANYRPHLWVDETGRRESGYVDGACLPSERDTITCSKTRNFFTRINFSGIKPCDTAFFPSRITYKEIENVNTRSKTDVILLLGPWTSNIMRWLHVISTSVLLFGLYVLVQELVYMSTKRFILETMPTSLNFFVNFTSRCMTSSLRYMRPSRLDSSLVALPAICAPVALPHDKK